MHSNSENVPLHIVWPDWQGGMLKIIGDCELFSERMEHVSF